MNRKRNVYTVAQYLNDMQSEGLNGEREIREMAEDETEDENMQGEDRGAPG